MVGIPMDINCAPLIADLFLFCYERDFMKSLWYNSQADIILAFNNTCRYLDDILNIDNQYFEQYKAQIYPVELILVKSNTNDQDATFLDLRLMLSDGTVSVKIYDKREDFDFCTVNYPNLDGDVPTLPSYGVYISQLTRHARACTHVGDLNERNAIITSKLLNQGFRYHKLRKCFCRFFYRNSDLVHKYNTTLNTLIKDGISHPVFYGDVVYKIRCVLNFTHFPVTFCKIIRKHIKLGYKPSILRCTASLAVSTVCIDNYNHLFSLQGD